MSAGTSRFAVALLEYGSRHDYRRVDRETAAASRARVAALRPAMR